MRWGCWGLVLFVCSCGDDSATPDASVDGTGVDAAEDATSDGDELDTADPPDAAVEPITITELDLDPTATAFAVQDASTIYVVTPDPDVVLLNAMGVVDSSFNYTLGTNFDHTPIDVVIPTSDTSPHLAVIVNAFDGLALFFTTETGELDESVEGTGLLPFAGTHVFTRVRVGLVSAHVRESGDIQVSWQTPTRDALVANSLVTRQLDPTITTSTQCTTLTSGSGRVPVDSIDSRPWGSGTVLAGTNEPETRLLRLDDDCMPDIAFGPGMDAVGFDGLIRFGWDDIGGPMETEMETVQITTSADAVYAVGVPDDRASYFLYGVDSVGMPIDSLDPNLTHELTAGQTVGALQLVAGRLVVVIETADVIIVQTHDVSDGSLLDSTSLSLEGQCAVVDTDIADDQFYLLARCLVDDVRSNAIVVVRPE